MNRAPQGLVGRLARALAAEEEQDTQEHVTSQTFLPWHMGSSYQEL